MSDKLLVILYFVIGGLFVGISVFVMLTKKPQKVSEDEDAKFWDYRGDRE